MRNHPSKTEPVPVLAEPVRQNRYARTGTPEPVPFEALPRLAVLAGPAGIGKTKFCLEHFSRLIRESQDPMAQDLLYLLPTVEHRERIVDLILRKEGGGFFGQRVTTLSRLMQDLLKTEEGRLATDAERRFLVSEILAESGGEYFSAVRGLAGFLDRISEFIGELKDSLVTLGDFQKGMERLARKCPPIRQKYEELVQIYEQYEKSLERLGFRDPRDGLFLLRRAGRRPRFRVLFLDGFFDFSKSQLEFLRWLSEHSDQMVLTLTVDLSRERKGLFQIPLETLEMLRTLGFETVDWADGTNRRAASEALAHVEKNLFRELSPLLSRRSSPSPLTLFPPGGEGRVRGAGLGAEPLLVLEATGIRGEVEMIAREIRRVVRRENLHDSDIAVILRWIGEYAGVVRSVFREFGIPVEIHERERLRDTSLARTVASFFKILLEEWRREDLFNFLKSSAVERDDSEVCSLEIRGFRQGISQGRERWLQEVGGGLLEKIASFQDRFQAAQTVDELIRLTEEVFESFGLTRIPISYDEKARRDFAALKRLQGLLREIRGVAEARGSREKGFAEFAKQFLGLIEVDLFSLHERDKNCVQIYDVSLARQKEYKVVFLAGLLEKYFPVEIREDPILADEERREIGLRERLPRQALERYLFYVGLTRAQERIILSYPRFNLEGHEALPSFYVDEVRRLFSDSLPTLSYPVSQALPRLEEVVEERELEAHLVKRLFEKSSRGDRSERSLTLSLYNRLLERSSFQSLIPKLLFDPVAQIEDPEVRAAFLPRGGVFKPTGLEAHGRCPFRYFASDVLELEEQEEGIDARRVGILLHEVLEAYWRERIEKQNKKLEAVRPAREFVKKKLHELIQEEPLGGDRRYRIELKAAEMEGWLIRMVEKEITQGAPLEPFRPGHVELAFSFGEKGGEPLTLYDPFKEDLKLRGKIDRVDVDPSGTYALVIDYKTGKAFSAKDLEFGTALQLPLYLLAVQKLLKLKPAGGQIYQINEAKANGFYSREGLEKGRAQVRSRRVLDTENFNQLLERAVKFSRKYAEGISRAEISVRPRDCDERCPFPALCRIEKWRLPFIYQEIRKED